MSRHRHPRRVVGLQQVRWAQNPWPKSRSRGAKALGLRYEAAVARALPAAARGRWIWFEDMNGPGYASPDLLLWGEEFGPLVVECKLTVTGFGWEQLEGLYQPLLEALLGRPVGICMVAKNLRPGFTAEAGPVRPGALVQWLGHGPLAPSSIPWDVGVRKSSRPVAAE